MKITIISTLVLVATSLAGFSQQKSQYTIAGYLPSYQQPLIYLRKIDQIVDSAKVTNGKFTFKGSVTEPTNAGLTNRKDQGISFILENTDMTVTGKDGNLENAVLDGIGNTQKEQNALEESKLPVNEKLQVLGAEFERLSSIKDSIAANKLMLKGDSLSNQLTAMDITFIRTHSKSFQSLFLIWALADQRPYAELKPLYDHLDAELKNSRSGNKVKNKLDQIRTNAIGQLAPDFKQNDVNGKSIGLSSFRGKYVLVDFWASWCGPCRAENPNLLKTYQQFAAQGFEVLGVSLDNSAEKWKSAIAADKLPWQQVSDLKGWKNEAGQLYGVQAVPSSFLLDPQGVIIARDLRGEALTQFLSGIFNK